MKAKKCDFCGVLYEEETLSIIDEFVNAALDLYPFYTSRGLVNKIEILVDICPECQETLIKTFDELRGKRK